MDSWVSQQSVGGGVKSQPPTPGQLSEWQEPGDESVGWSPPASGDHGAWPASEFLLQDGRDGP